MLIRVLAVLVVWILAAPLHARPLPLLEQDKQDDAKEKKDKKEKKPKKAKKPKSDVPAPDEKTDNQVVDTGGDKGVRVSWKQHPSFRAGSWFRADFTAKFQEDGRQTYKSIRTCNDTRTTNCFEPWEMHRNRIGVSGHLFKKIEYEAEYELTEKELTEKDLEEGVTPASHWKDLYVNVAFIDNAQVQIGKFKVPFGLDQLTGVSQNDFVFRSLGASYLAPARDIGFTVHGSFFKRGLRYWVGGFQHDGDNARSKKIQGGDETVAGRVTAMPFRKAGKGLGAIEVGTAFTFSRLSDDSFRPNGLRGRTLMSQETFYEPVYVKGNRTRWEADADWMGGPFGARAEFTQVLDDRLSQGLLDNDLVDARARAWYVSGSWLVTGDKKERPIKPKNDFLQGGIGAVELVSRVERLWFDSVGGGEPYRSVRAESILPASNKVFTVGVNWTLNRFIKLQFDAMREKTDGVRDHSDETETNPVQGMKPFWSRVVRLQLVL